MQIYCHQQKYSEGLAYIAMSQSLLHAIPGLLPTADFVFYSGLIIAAQYGQAHAKDGHDLYQQLEAKIAQLAVWSESSPENFEHKKTLLLAEKARISGDNWQEVLAYYESSIRLSTQVGLQPMQALSNQRAGCFCLEIGNSQKGRYYLAIAYNLYQRWGSHDICQLLIRKHPLIEGFLENEVPHSSLLRTRMPDKNLRRASLDRLKMMAVVKASQTISSEINSSQLLKKVINIIITHAGAQNGGIFLLSEEGLLHLVIEHGLKEKTEFPVLIQAATQSVNEPNYYPSSVIRYVERTQTTLLLASAKEDQRFNRDPYIITHKVQSVLCFPIMNQSQMKGVIYLENNLINNVFSQENSYLARLLVGQLVISLENARLYQQLEEFIDRICHEIRNPLTGIFGNVDLLNASLKNIIEIFNSINASETVRKNVEAFIAEQQEALAAINECAKHQEVITNDVLMLSKLDAGAMSFVKEPFSLNRLCQTLSHMFANNMRLKTIKFSLDLPADELLIQGDEYRIKQVLINLLSNAIKFTPANGCITLEVKVVYSTRDEISFQICVKDTGIGILLDKLPQLFNRFSQGTLKTSHQYGGSGLGLVICKKLIKAMNGSIEVQSEKGQGASFVIRLTCAAVTAAQRLVLTKKVSSSELTEEAQFAASSRLLEVLIVEDNPINAKILLRLLESLHCHCDIAVDGLKAVEQFQNKKYQIIFMDVEMPNMTGLEATQVIRALEKQQQVIPVMIVGLSGNMGEKHEQLAKQAGMDQYLHKPYSKTSIQQLLSKYQTNSFSSPILKPFVVIEKPPEKTLTDETMPTTTALLLDKTTCSVHSLSEECAVIILMAEDNRLNQRILGNLLNKLGYPYVIANNGQEAVDQYATGNYTHVLMDLEMPVKNGIEAIKEIRVHEESHKLNSAFIICLTANAREAYRVEALSTGANSYLVKPYQKEKIDGAIRAGVSYRQQQKDEKRERSAVTIQALFRGYWIRKQQLVLKKKQEKVLHDVLESTVLPSLIKKKEYNTIRQLMQCMEKEAVDEAWELLETIDSTLVETCRYTCSNG